MVFPLIEDKYIALDITVQMRQLDTFLDSSKQSSIQQRQISLYSRLSEMNQIKCRHTDPPHWRIVGRLRNNCGLRDAYHGSPLFFKSITLLSYRLFVCVQGPLHPVADMCVGPMNCLSGMYLVAWRYKHQ